MRSILHTEIGKVAFELYEKSGWVEGCDIDNWLKAEKIVKLRYKKQEKLDSNENRIEISLPAYTTAFPSDAESYLSAARSFLAGTEALARCTVKELTSCVFLAAQALECALKAYLSHSGFTEKQLKERDLRHNLEALWEKASINKLSISSTPPQWCIILNAGYDKPYYMRYPKGVNIITNPEIRSMVEELKEIVDKVGANLKKK